MGYTEKKTAEAIAMTHFDDYPNYDATGLAELLHRRELTASEVLEAAIQRIEAGNPTLNAITHADVQSAREQAVAWVGDAPLAGVPFLMKDLYYFQNGLPATQGSRLFQDFIADHDSTLVKRYRQAGLLMLGKTNTPEFGLSASTEPVLFGPTHNPWRLDHSPGGSSGGAAAAVAAGWLPMAHATDGGGSIRIPAANCGLFGLKPSRGRLPVGPVLGETSGGLSVAHCVSRSVRDSALLLDLSHGPEVGDPYAAPAVQEYFRCALHRPPPPLRIALLTTTLDGQPLHPTCVQAAEDAARLCEALGHRLELATPPVAVAQVAMVWRVIVGVGLWATISQRAAALGREPQADDVEAITWQWAMEGRQRSGVEYLQAVQLMHRIGRQLGNFFQHYDVLLSPVLSNPPQPLGSTDMNSGNLDDYFYRQLMAEIPITPLFNVSGGPAMSVPLHWSDDGLPVGVHFGAALGQEPLLLALAGQLEQARPWFQRRPPSATLPLPRQHRDGHG